MTEASLVPRAELEARRDATRARLAERRLDALLITTPENIHYLTGLDHQGFFAFHALLLPLEGVPVLVARAMERVTVAHQVAGARFVGYGDGEAPARVVRDVLVDGGMAAARIGVERTGLFLPPAVHDAIVAGLEDARFIDASSLVANLRLVKSPYEIACLRAAARVTDAMMTAALAAAAPGVNEKDIAAEVHRAMIRAGGEPPGFGPFIRAGRRLGEEHTTWCDHRLERGEALFLEMAGCVRRYHAPMGRLVHLGEAPPGTETIEAVCREAFEATTAALRPGTTAADVYGAWQGRVDAAGLAGYRRHHCGYAVGLAFPPSWTGGAMVVGLRHDSAMEIRTGMAFHVLSWLLGSGRGDAFRSETVIVTEQGCDVLTASSKTG